MNANDARYVQAGVQSVLLGLWEWGLKEPKHQDCTREKCQGWFGVKYIYSLENHENKRHVRHRHIHQPDARIVCTVKHDAEDRDDWE